MNTADSPTNFGLSMANTSTLIYATRRRTRASLIVLPLVALILFAGSCQRQQQPEAARDRSTIKIGFFGDLSGPTFNFGESAKNGVLMAADEINQDGGIDGRKIDVVIDDDRGSPERAAMFAVNTLKAKKAAILFDFNSPYSRGLTDYFELSFAKLGGQIVGKLSYTQGDADFKGQLSAIQIAAPDVIYIPGYYGDVAVIAKQSRQIGLKQSLLGGDGWDAPELWQLGGDALNGSFISTHYSVDDPSPVIQKFVHEYKQRYGNLLPDAHAALAYDATRMLAQAIERSGSTDGNKVRTALAQTKDFPGVTGVISMDANRNAVKPAVILELEDGSYIYKETIQPGVVNVTPSPSPSPSATKKRRR